MVSRLVFAGGRPAQFRGESVILPLWGGGGMVTRQLRRGGDLITNSWKEEGMSLGIKLCPGGDNTGE